MLFQLKNRLWSETHLLHRMKYQVRWGLRRYLEPNGYHVNSIRIAIRLDQIYLTDGKVTIKTQTYAKINNL